MLATLEDRIDLLLEAGADEVAVLQFDADLAATEPETFVEELLVGRLGVREVVVGENFRFGHRARGTTQTLQSEGHRLGFEVSVLPLVGSGEQRWSSTRTRRLVAAGEMADATAALGRPYRLDGIVVHGDHRGRELGFPTANMQWTGSPTIPADGVYAGWLNTSTDRFPAAISVGTNPQFDGQERRVEAYVLDRDDLDLYGQAFSIEFTDRIRGQETFADVAGLIARMSEDVAAARTLLGIRA
jgi:riboflavin kinase/FMN adenylyltransferase